MALSRTTETPPYVDFLRRYLVDGVGIPPPSPLALSLTSRRLRIPSFQRGIQWKSEQLEKLLDTKSRTIGTVIVGQSREEMPVLVDGLQRFAIGTALLESLYPLVLSPNESRVGDSAHFPRLRASAGALEPIFSHNARSLRNHRRSILRDSYTDLSDAISKYVRDKLDTQPAGFGGSIEVLFYDRLVGIDEYRGFESDRELSNTFIAINTQGVDLEPVDLLRSKLVDRAIDLDWNADDVEEMENRFSEIFGGSTGKPQLKALGAALDDALGDSATRHHVFPTWAQLAPNHVNVFLDFIAESVASGTDTSASPEFPFFRELFDCGPQAFTIVFLYFWYKHQTRHRIADFAGGTFATEPELGRLLRAFYRRLIDGTIFRVESATTRLVRGGGAVPLSDVLTLVAPDDVGALASDPSREWLSDRLRTLDPRQSRRVFNACLLPRRGTTTGFRPARFGRAANDWSIDHLIPESRAPRSEAGGLEARRLPNLAPFPSKLNTSQRTQECSLKLSPGGTYVTVVGRHPFISWLVRRQYADLSNKGDLDSPAELLRGSESGVGDARVEFLVEYLLPRI